MIEVKEISSTKLYKSGLIVIDKKTSISYYTYDEAKEIKKQLNQLLPDTEV